MRNQTETFGDALATGIARLSIKTLADRRFAVVRYLPTGMDIGPHVYGRFETLSEAQTVFNSKRESVARLVESELWINKLNG